ncbi:hypothetical protein AK830_g8469 [Neonectria ditissima]|uniref:U three protein 23 n=1 Tax=Neonectria ditissima TaxID=78410 RepID=A0A0P7AXA5_9HYPO|nr:hypothetical protein AK830_g8469 [Neonectria ditissima]
MYLSSAAASPSISLAIFGLLCHLVESKEENPPQVAASNLADSASVDSWNAQSIVITPGVHPDILPTIAPSPTPGMAAMSLWARLVLHFWSTAIDEEVARYLSTEQPCEPNPIANLQAAYEQTLKATEAHDCLGTTTTCGAQLHFKIDPDDESRQNPSPLLYVTNIGDCKVLVLRPKAEEVIYRTTEQWHWFDCPRQLGTNSPDTPNNIAVMDTVDLEVGDVVLAMSDGVTDNLWEHEIVTSVLNSVREWESSPDAGEPESRAGGRNGGMDAAARDLVAAAKKIAQDPFAESPFMEHAIEEGLASEGAKWAGFIARAPDKKFISRQRPFASRSCRCSDFFVASLTRRNPIFAQAPNVTMRGKRSKQYRKLMEQFSMTFGFREPYQILVDAEMVRDSCRFKMELAPALERTVHGKAKPMITQCEIRKLYAQNKEPGAHEAIEVAKTLERRRCGHHPDQYPEPLSTQECLQSVVDPKGTSQNKHRYVVASQSQEVRRMLRGIKGVPLIYIKRSVMILEPMADESVQVRAREERSKFRAELRGSLGKRKREDDDEDDEKDEKDNSKAAGGDKATQGEDKKKKKKGYGPKQPNPLAVQKAKKEQSQRKREGPRKGAGSENKESENKEPGQEEPAKRKRRRKAKASSAATGEAEDSAPPAEAVVSAES